MATNIFCAKFYGHKHFLMHSGDWYQTPAIHCIVTSIAHGRVTTCLDNLEMSGNLIAVRDFTDNQGIVREKILSGKSCL